MGGLVWRVGDYSASIMDYEYPEQYDDDDNELEIDKNHIFNVKIESELNNSKKEMQVPLHELFDLDENNHWKVKETKTPRDWLFNKISNTEKGVLIVPSLDLFNPSEYFLISDIFDEDIKIGIEPKMYKIKDLKELEWLFSKGLNYSSRKARYSFEKRVLRLPIKKQWLDMIRSDIKKEEYREIKPYWVSRIIQFDFPMLDWQVQDFCNEFVQPFRGFIKTPSEVMSDYGASFKEYDEIELINGYGNSVPRLIVNFAGVEIKRGNKKWGAGDDFCFSLKINNRG